VNKNSKRLIKPVHGNVLSAAAKKDIQLISVLKKYSKLTSKIEKLTILTKDDVKQLVTLFNKYRREVNYILEKRANSGQENLRSTILEEFFYYLIKDVVNKLLKPTPDNLVIGKADSYIDLTFSPASFISVFTNPNPYIHTKMQDFVLGASVLITVKNDGDDKEAEVHRVVVPVVAIECKTYIESNMLDSCAGTARRLKSAMPYCLYLVVAEYMKMEEVTPELTEINEVYILCKATNGERLERFKNRIPPHDMDAELVWDTFEKIRAHLNKIWWSPSDALSRGKIIDRP